MVHRKIDRTPAELAELEAVRERFQRERPSLAQLLASGEYTEPIPQATYVELRCIGHALRKTRENSGLSLADLSSLTGMDKAGLSRLENGQSSPTVSTLSRYADALGKRLVVALADKPK